MKKNLLCCTFRSNKDEHKEHDIWHNFLRHQLPIFWIIGPPKCGKSSLARLLAYCSSYRLLETRSLCRQITGKAAGGGDLHTITRKDKIIEVIKAEISKSFKNTRGYIIDDFPTNLAEANMFNKRICAVTLVIYVYLSFDALMGRVLSQEPAIDMNQIRIAFIKAGRKVRKISDKFDHKLLEVYNQFPLDKTCTRVLMHLEDDFGYKFQRLRPDKYL